MSSFSELHQRLQKPRPSSLNKKDRKLEEDRVYRQNSAIARERDGHRCRVCGRHWGLETHHVKPRSLNRRSKSKHDVDRLITLCAGDKSCHQAVTGKAMKLFAQTDDGTDGPILVTKWDDQEGAFITAMEAA